MINQNDNLGSRKISLSHVCNTLLPLCYGKIGNCDGNGVDLTVNRFELFSTSAMGKLPIKNSIKCLLFLQFPFYFLPQISVSAPISTYFSKESPEPLKQLI